MMPKMAKIRLPVKFEDAVRALLRTPPPPEGDPASRKGEAARRKAKAGTKKKAAPRKRKRP